MKRIGRPKPKRAYAVEMRWTGKDGGGVDAWRGVVFAEDVAKAVREARKLMEKHLVEVPQDARVVSVTETARNH